jgi:hypothetical protein
MDPITIGLAFTAAQTAVKGIKQAIALGKDVQSITAELGSFFKSSAEVKVAAIEAQRAANDPKCTEDVTMMALDIVLKEKQLRDDEESLKNMIIYELDSAEVWFAMENKRNEILEKRRLADQAKIKAATEAKLERDRMARKKARERAELMNTVEIATGVIISMIMIIGFVYGGYYVINTYK